MPRASLAMLQMHRGSQGCVCCLCRVAAVLSFVLGLLCGAGAQSCPCHLRTQLCLSCSNLTHVSMGCELLWSWQDGLGCAYLRFTSVPCKFFIQPQTLGLLRMFLTYIGLALIPLKLDYRVLCLF